MIICINNVFARLFKKATITDESMDQAIREVLQGSCVALGHKLYKKRIPSRTKGKRGAYRSGDLMVFIYLFAKNDRENITPKEMKELYSFLASSIRCMGKKSTGQF